MIDHFTQLLVQVEELPPSAAAEKLSSVHFSKPFSPAPLQAGTRLCW